MGGTLAGVAAALETAKAGGSVLVTTHRSYLGEDVCDSLRLAFPEDLDLSDPLVRCLYGSAVENQRCVRPMRIKHELDRALLEADIPVLLCAAPVEIAEEGGRVRLEVQTRSGARSLSAGRILDATTRGEAGRLAGVPLTSPTSPVSVTRRVIGGEPEDDARWTEEGRVEFDGDEGPVTESLWALTREVRLEDGGWDAWMRMEQDARLAAYRPGQSQSADGISAWTGERLHPDRTPVAAGGRVDRISGEAVFAAGNRIGFAGPVVNVDDATREALSRPDGAVAWGRRLASLLESSPVEGESFSETDIPEVEVDVLVVGGGTGGAPAGIGAARTGARTLVAEALSGLGGVGTLGLIGRYWFGNRVGFTAEVDAGAKARTTREVEKGWDIEAKMQWYHEQISVAGGRIWYKTALAEALTDGQRVVGAILATPQGPVRVRAGCVVDATGCGEIAARAGAETVPIGQGGLALQGTGLPGRTPGQHYRNTDYDFIDDSDAADAQSAHITAREKFQHAFDAGQHIDSRERRRIVGDLEITPMDIRLGRIFPDTLVKARSNFDTHGYTLHPLFMIVPPGHDPLEAYIPLRALLPMGIDGVLVTGLGISAHRDAMPVIRMQADVQNQGYAAGVAASRVSDGRVRELDIDALQAHLVEMGVLDPEVRGAGDSFPLPEEEIESALHGAPEDPNLIDRVFTLPEFERNERLRRAHGEADTVSARRFYAFVLGILGDAAGVEDLMEEVGGTDWDEGWDYTGMGQFGASMSPLDARIIALGRCGDSRAVTVLRGKAETLPDPIQFSHVRALAEAFATLDDPSAAPGLDALLGRPGVAGHAIATQAERDATATGDANETSFRNRSLIELHLATALARLDPTNVRAREVLAAYARDLRGLFARHARGELGVGS